MKVVGLTYFPSLTSSAGKRGSGSWSALCERLSIARVVRRKDEAPGFSLATFANDRRSLANVERVFAVGLDLDHLDALPLAVERTDGEIIAARTWDDVKRGFAAVESFSHTTWSSTIAAPRARVFLRLSRPVAGDEYRLVYSACTAHVERYGFLVDRQASDPSRFWYLPSIPPRGFYRYAIGRGPAVDVDAAIASVTPAAAPTAPSSPRPSTPAGADIEERAARYALQCEIAISGAEGHKTTFNVCQKIVRGFALDEATAFRVLASWNARCKPPWSERELRRKIAQAIEHGTMRWGELRDRGRAA